ncbi:MAG: nucleoside hydrolase [Hyphomicrobiales bacterium]|nr:nucleoside hydrolase [Hyphomicrobiales bacterium]
MPTPVIIDTDPGLDDALALFIACASPELDIIAITTVAGNIGLWRTTTNALKLLHHLGRDEIPVIAGSAQSLRRGAIEAAPIHGEDGLGGADILLPERRPLAIEASEWMARELLRRPSHSVRILALGPLTNVAQLVESRPDAARRLAGIIAMGGAVREAGNVTQFAEFNIAADPEAASIVFGSGIAVTLVPLDVTRKVLADREWNTTLSAKGGKVAQTAQALIEAYLRNFEARVSAKGKNRGALVQPFTPKFPMHDPCVVLRAIEPGLFGAEALALRVVIDRSERDGATVIDSEAGQLVEVLTRVDSGRALAAILAKLVALP